MTVKTEAGQPFCRLRIMRRRTAMAAHAAFVLCGEPRQELPVFVTGTAFRFGRPGEIDLCVPGRARHLGVRVMAPDAELQLFSGLPGRAPVGPVADLIEDLGVAVRAPLRPKEVPQGLVDVLGIRVGPPFRDVRMAFQAGDPAVDRHVKCLRVDQPGCLSCRHAAGGEREQEDREPESADLLSPPSRP